METLKLSFVMGALALAGGCIGTVKESDTSTTTTSTSDSKDSKDSKDTEDSGTTDTTTSSTGTNAALFFQGEAAGNGKGMEGDGATSGKYGFAMYPYSFADDFSDITGKALCHAYIELEPSGNVPSATCDTCEFAYSLVATENGNRDGAECDAMDAAGVPYVDPTILTKYFGPGAKYEVNVSFGWVPDYKGYGFPVVYMYDHSDGSTGKWFLFAYNVDDVSRGFNSKVELSADNTISWTRAITDKDGYEYYYPY